VLEPGLCSTFDYKTEFREEKRVFRMLNAAFYSPVKNWAMWTIERTVNPGVTSPQSRTDRSGQAATYLLSPQLAVRVGGSMTWPQVAFSSLLASVLIAGWHRYAISSKPLPKALELYLWVAPILNFTAYGLIHDRAGLRGLVPLAIVHLAVIAWALRAVYLGTPGHFNARLAGFLLIFGAAAVWLGAISYVGMGLPEVAAHRADHLFTAGGFLVGALLSLSGFVALRAVLRERGDALLSQLGLIALLIATVCWIVHLTFRATVMVAVAQASAAAPPDWYQPLRLWAGAMYVGYMFLAYLSIAAYGAAMGKTGWAGKWWGRTFIAFGLVSAVTGSGASGVPLAVQFMPYAMGMILLRRARAAAVPGAAVGGRSS